MERADRRLYSAVGFVACLGLIAVASSVSLGIDLGEPFWATTVAVTFLIAIGDFLNVEVRIRSSQHGSAWADAGVLVGLALLPVQWVVAATAVGITLAMAVRRVRPVQFTFAVAKETTIAAVGGLVLAAQATSGSPDAPVAIPTLAAAFVAMTIADQLLTIPVIALATRTPVLERFRSNWDIRLLMAAGRFAVVAIAVLALQAQAEFVYALPVVVLIGHLWHERWVRAREERQAWQNLAAATEAFTGVELDKVLHVGATGGATLFCADEIEVETWLGLDRRLVRGSAAQIIYDGDPADAPADGANVYAVALHGYPGRRDVGALRLRFRSQIRMSDREHAMLSSYAASLDTAIRNAAAYGQLGEATAAHAHAAAHDPLTGLANRRELERHLCDALTTATTLDCRVALLMIDLKHFKEVNDTLGHLAGDQVLRQVAGQLSAAAGRNDLVARFGGDEFALLLRSAYRSDRVRARAERVLGGLTQPMEVDGLPLVIEANAGLALAVDPQDEPPGSPSDQDDQEQEPGSPGEPEFRASPTTWMAELMRRADVAMYQAKRASQPLACYAPGSDTADRHRLALAGQLSHAVSQRQFVLNYQPIVDLATGKVHGAEALARWRHPIHGQLEPRWFLDLIERSNHLAEFTAAVLDDALTAADTWHAAGHRLSVSVNISPRSLLDPHLPRMVLDALDNHRTSPELLCLELTETLAISQLDTVDQVLTQLHDIGVRLALDDFGTGYSSLAALSRIPVHQLKIDRSFIHTLRHPWPAEDGGGEDSSDAGDVGADVGDEAASADDLAQARAVVRSTVQLGRTLDLAVVAEGIETLAQRRLLWQMGCTLGQGHMFAAPLPADRLLAYVTQGLDDHPGALAPPLPDGGNVVPFSQRRLPEQGTRPS